MSKQSLIDRQLRLFRHLTSPELVFGDAERAASDPALQGMDLGRLRLEAEFSFWKRMGKIRKCLPLTFKYLGRRVPELSREFLKDHPPTTYLRYVQARLFYDFLTAKWKRQPPEPEFLPDLARLEIAIAKILVFRYRQGNSKRSAGARPPAFRCHGSAELVHCRFDIRGLLGRKPSPETPPRRDVYLLVTMLFDYLYPRVFEIPRSLFERMQDVPDWALSREMLAELSPLERESIESLHQIGALEYA